MGSADALNLRPDDKALPTARQRLQGLVNWESRARQGMHPGLEPVRDLLARLGDPHLGLRCVHVTGTKGKGTVCALIEAALGGAGHRVGRYASPHVERLNERICLDGTPIDDARLDAALARVLDRRDAACAASTPGAQSTWFDVLTATAFVCFAEAALDWVLVEVGLGGRLDSTNVVLPALAVLTNVGLEHTEVLGPTLQHIAREKAGIAKAGRPLLSAVPPGHPGQPVIARCAAEAGAQLVALDLRDAPGLSAANLGLARAALDLLGAQGHRRADGRQPLGAADLPDGLAQTVRLPARLEHFDLVHPATGAAIPVVLDGAHVGFAVTAMLDEVIHRWGLVAPPVVVLAMAADKNADDIVARLAGRVRACVCTTLPCARPSWSAEALAAICRAQGVEAQAEPDPGAALRQAQERLLRGDWLLVTGSFSVAGWARGALGGLQAV